LDEGPSHRLIAKIKTLFGRRDPNRAATKFEEDVQELIDEGAEKGVITSKEGEMIQSIFDFGDTIVREIMIPRTDVVAASQDATLSEVIQLSRQHGHSRLPVYQKDIDHIVGILHVKNLLDRWGSPPDEALSKNLLRQPYFIPEVKKIGELLAEFRTRKTHMAVVLDEYGGTAGLITLEDIIEEIVGEIQDEYDTEDQRIIRLSNDTVLVDARLHLEELSEFLNIELPEGNYDSVGGFIIDLLGKVPEVKEQIEFQDLLMTIRSGDERKISQVEIKCLDHTDILNSGNS